MRRPLVVTDPAKVALSDVDSLAGFGTATVHEAMGRTGLAGPQFRPIQSGTRVAGTAVTVVCWPGDNLMIHVAVEQCSPGDILVVTTNSLSTDGLFGELFATALQARGVRGLVIDAGVRDVADLNKMGFPAWATSVSTLARSFRPRSWMCASNSSGLTRRSYGMTPPFPGLSV